LAECCIGGPYTSRSNGASLDLRTYAPALGVPELLYGEDQGRVVLSLPAARRHDLAMLAREHGVRLFGAGKVTGHGTALELLLPDGSVAWDVQVLRRIYMEAIPRRMAAVATSTGEGQ